MKGKSSLRGREVSVLKVLAGARFPGCAHALSGMMSDLRSSGRQDWTGSPGQRDVRDWNYGLNSRVPLIKSTH